MLYMSTIYIYMCVCITQSSKCYTLIQCQKHEDQNFLPHLWSSSVVVDYFSTTRVVETFGFLVFVIGLRCHSFISNTRNNNKKYIYNIFYIFLYCSFYFISHIHIACRCMLWTCGWNFCFHVFDIGLRCHSFISNTRNNNKIYIYNIFCIFYIVIFTTIYI